ncbi:hypothetical protein HPB48_019652 [Haemaphysalis longicornis]|uniref:Uncharacterized protein n=1 Tax=Haemaphysalis longicornis TaxID=44386 RepID=A0A9J6G4V5_HAELO|nr:hypothetical protein HPB48_019652 [Haemaphysalis longicornis]
MTSSPSRVVNVVSDYHRLGDVSRLEDKARGINPLSNPTAVYGNTKLALSLFTIALAERLKHAGVTANFLHPGAVKTGIADKRPGLRKFFFYLLLGINGKRWWCSSRSCCSSVRMCGSLTPCVQSQATMEGKTVIVTGATSGVGRETAKELARRKARVIIGCRNLNTAKDVAQEIFEETKQQVVIKHLDLHSLKSVRNFCDDILRTERRLDVLINNAGSVGRSKEVKLTEDGFEEVFQANHLAPFLLTILLVDLLKKSSPSRVVNVTSNYHRLGEVNRLEDRARGVNPVRNPMAVYGNAKLAFCMSTIALAERLKDAGVTANFLHPGSVDTQIVEEGSRLRKFFFYVSLIINGKTPLQGAQTSIRLAVDPDLEGTTGEYFDNCVPAVPQFEARAFPIPSSSRKCSARR